MRDISVVMTAYNQERYIGRALASVLAQKVRPSRSWSAMTAPLTRPGNASRRLRRHTTVPTPSSPIVSPPTSGRWTTSDGPSTGVPHRGSCWPMETICRCPPVPQPSVTYGTPPKPASCLQTPC